MTHALRAALAALTLTLLALAAGCGSDHDDADVAFARQMVPHHQQAVEMARMAATHDAGTEVRDLAARIEAAQQPEIRTMQGWLEDWGDDHDSMGSMDHGSGTSGMGGMMSQRDMSALDAARGPAFDRLFLTQMIAHHEGAIDMAREELDRGEDADAKALARRVEKTQAAEVTEMKALLKQVG